MKVGVFINLSENVCNDIRRMHSLGFDNCQLNSLPPFGEYSGECFSDEIADKINAVCKELNFTITAVFAGWSGYHNFGYPEMYKTLGFVPGYLRDRRMKDVLAGADFAAKLNVKNVFTHIGYLRDDPHDEQREAIVVTLRYIADHLKKNGQALQIETGEMLPVSLVQLFVEIDRDNVGVNFDPANFLINGRANPSDALNLLLPYVKGVHAKDAVYPTGTNPKGHQCPVGEGQVDFAYIIRTLLKSGYEGCLTIEREITGDQQIKDIVNAAEYLRAMINKIEKE